MFWARGPPRGTPKIKTRKQVSEPHCRPLQSIVVISDGDQTVFFLVSIFWSRKGGPLARELCSQFFLAFTNFRKFSMTQKYLLLSRLPRIINHFPVSHVVGHMVRHWQHPVAAPYNFTEGMGANSRSQPRSPLRGPTRTNHFGGKRARSKYFFVIENFQS